MSERSGRLVENVLALMGGLALFLAATAHPLRDLGVQLGACLEPGPHRIPWESLIVGVVCVMPKTISRATASNFVGAVAARVGTMTSATLRALRPPPEDSAP